MDSLIAELERATKGSRELDEAIHRIVAPEEWTIQNSPFTWPDYTDSLDAALTLYKTRPDMIPTNPLKACVEALK